MLKIIKVCLFGCFLLAQFGVIAALDVSKTIDNNAKTIEDIKSLVIADVSKTIDITTVASATTAVISATTTVASATATATVISATTTVAITIDVSKTIDTTTATTQEQNITSDAPEQNIENDAKEQDTVFNDDVDKNNITFKIGTLGVGIDYIYALNDSSNLRFNANAWSRDTTLNDTEVAYAAEISLQSLGLIYDYHPFGSVLRLSVGTFYNGSSFDIEAKPTSNISFTFNNTNYSIQDAGDITGSVELKSFSPYIGFGGGSSPHGGGFFGTGLAFAFDIGALYTQYEAKLSSNNCTIPIVLLTNGCSELASDIEIERVKLQDNLNDLKWYPVISFGLSYKF